MNNKETVREYAAQWTNKGKNPNNGCSLRQSTYGCNYAKGDNSFHVRWDEEDDTIWAMMACMLGLNQPAAAVPSKIDDYWKSYAKQTRGDLTRVEQELANQKAAYNALCEVHKEMVEKVVNPTTFDLNIETGKSYAVFGLSRDRGFAIYNACAEVVLGNYRFFKIAAYIQKVWELSGCSSEAERLYANYIYGWMGFGYSSTPMNAAQIESYRLEFKEYGNKTSAAEYDDSHDYEDN